MLPRPAAVEALASEEFDVLVIGGGITGAGVALYAASRGYSAALVERGDFASGTSSRSSKMIHGGLRYLRTYDFGIVRESLLERRLMVRLAPHLVHPIPMLSTRTAHHVAGRRSPMRRSVRPSATRRTPSQIVAASSNGRSASGRNRIEKSGG